MDRPAGSRCGCPDQVLSGEAEISFDCWHQRETEAFTTGNPPERLELTGDGLRDGE